MPSARATIAAWPVGAPAGEGEAGDELRPDARDDRRVEVVRGDDRAACRRDGADRAGSGPISRSRTRRPTSRRSAARSRKYGSSTPASKSACSAATRSMASSADAPPRIAAIAGSRIPGSRAKSAWASKIAPISAPARPAVSWARSSSSTAAAARASSRRRSSAAIASGSGTLACRHARAWRLRMPGPVGGAPQPEQAPDAASRRVRTAPSMTMRGIAGRRQAATSATTPARTSSRSAADVAPGILVADAALAEVGGPALRREHRDGGRGSCRGRVARGTPTTAATSAPAVERARAAAAAGTSASSIVFSPVVDLPRAPIPVAAASRAVTKARPPDGGGSVGNAASAAGGPEEAGPVQRTRRAADGADQGPAGQPQQVGRRGGVGPSGSAGGRASSSGDDRR